MSEEQAQQRFYILDINGLIHDGRTDLGEVEKTLAQSAENLRDWDCDLTSPISFADVVRNAKPTVLVGATGHAGAFPEEIIREMAQHVERPIIFPLSNPTSRVEATPADLLKWTDGRALIATGSPFEPIEHAGVTHVIAQCNNSYIFPAMGLGILAAGATRVTDEMFAAAAIALKEKSPALEDPTTSLLPALDNIRDVARHIAIAVAAEAQSQGLAEKTSPEELEQRVDQTMWLPAYA